MTTRSRKTARQTRLARPARRGSAGTQSDKRRSDQRDRVCLRKLRVRGLLSFGPDAPEMEFGPLNVLIGPNASGKSNLIEALALLRDTPEFDKTPRSAGEWLWRGGTAHAAELTAAIETGNDPAERLRYAFRLNEADDRLDFDSERLERADGVVLFRCSNGREKILDPRSNTLVPVRLPKRNSIGIGFSTRSPRSALFRHRDERYPEIARLASVLSSWGFYRQWELGPQSPLRSPQRPALLQSDRLHEDARNLGLVLKRLQSQPATRAALLKGLRELYPGVESVNIEEWRAHDETPYSFLSVKEAGRFFPATRLSDGTLHWLCLLAILLDPTPPPLICIEEPEVGLHPDLLHVLVELLRAASERAQIFVTTHSTVLADALTETPEVVIVCERSDEGTSMRRLSHARLREWLEEFSLGDLWRRGQIGGTRW